MSDAARIMVIDNDERVGIYLREILETQQYAVHVVEGLGQNLIETAIQAARRFRPHVAIVDLRLVDDTSDDRTGLDLLAQLRSTRCILHSNHLTPEVLRTVRRKYPDVDWADKHDPQMVLSAIEEAAKQMSAQLKDTILVWPPRWERNQIVPLLVDENATELPADMIDDIVVQLFPQYHRIQPEALDGVIDDLQSVVRGGKFVVKVYPDHFEPQILKLSNAAKAQHEQARYSQYIQQMLAGLISTQLVRSVEFWDLGGAVYNFIGSSNQVLPTFATFYRKHSDPETILRPLRHFFTSVWRNHYEDSQSLQQTSLFEAYETVFALRTKLQRIDPNTISHLAEQLALDLPDPVHWVERFGLDSRIPRARQAVVHGNLHSNNLFVDGEHTWVIDFERAGPNHILRDFIELEIDLVTRMIDLSELNLSVFYRLVLVLTEPSEPGGHFQLAHIVAENAAARKAVNVIAGLREIAQTMTHYTDQHEYTWGLLFNALYVASAHSFNPLQKERALLLSAILCEKLRSWSAIWPPPKWRIKNDFTIKFKPDLSIKPASPFILHGPVSDNIFSGRELELRQITENINKSYAIIGGRRIGKSSLLRQAYNIQLSKVGFHVHYHDCSTTPTFESFLSMPLKARTAKKLSNNSITFADLLRNSPVDKYVILLLDEADKPVPYDNEHQWQLFSSLRSFVNSGNGQIVLGGERALHGALHNPASPLFNFVEEIILQPFNIQSTKELIDRAMKQLGIDLNNPEEIIRRIYVFTSGHPNVVQRLGNRLIAQLNQKNTYYITPDDVDAVVRDPVFQRDDFLSTYWEAASPLEKIISLVMADDESIRTLQSVREALKNRCNLQPKGREIEDALQHLVDLRSILNKTPTGYEFAVTAFPQVIAETMTSKDMLEVWSEEYLGDQNEIKHI